MGVTGLWQYLHEHNLCRSLSAYRRAADEDKARRNGDGTCAVRADHVYLDMNAFMHEAYDSAQPTTCATIQSVNNMLTSLLALMPPRLTLVAVFDGVTPSAKLLTQRKRRAGLPVGPPPACWCQQAVDTEAATTQPASLHTARQSASAACTRPTSSLHASRHTLTQAHGSAQPSTRRHCDCMCDLAHDSVALRREEIVTGSAFVYACQQSVQHTLSQYAQGRRLRQEKQQQQQERQDSNQSPSLSRHLDVTVTEAVQWHLSPCTEPGEGEVKIAAAVRRTWQQRANANAHDDDEVVTLVGNDSDLALVALLATHYHRLLLISPREKTVTNVGELLQHWSAAMPNPPLPAKLLPGYRVDFVFLMLLAGCDYYRGLGATTVALWRRYRHLRANAGYFRRALIVNEALELDVELMQAVVARDSKHARNVRCTHRRRKYDRNAAGSGTGNDMDSCNANEGRRLFRAVGWMLTSYLNGNCPDYSFSIQQNKTPTVASLRAALHSQSANALLRYPPPTSTNDMKTETVQNTKVDAVSPLEHYIAVLGNRGRYSRELQQAIDANTPDAGSKLTRTTSVSYIQQTVRLIVSNLDTNNLTGHERAMLQMTTNEKAATQLKM